MRVSSMLNKADRGLFGRLYRIRGWKGGHRTWFADNAAQTICGVGSTPEEAIRNLRYLTAHPVNH